jgi:hypothetical protein
MKLVDKRRVRATWQPIGHSTWLAPRKVCLRIVALHSRSATRLAALLPPPAYRSASAGSAQLRKAAGVDSFEGCLPRLDVHRDIVHLQSLRTPQRSPKPFRSTNRHVEFTRLTISQNKPGKLQNWSSAFTASRALPTAPRPIFDFGPAGKCGVRERASGPHRNSARRRRTACIF